MQVFIKFSVGLDAVELLKQIDELGESRLTKLLFTSHVRNVKNIVPYKIFFFFFFCIWFLSSYSEESKILIYPSTFFLVNCTVTDSNEYLDTQCP